MFFLRRYLRMCVLIVICVLYPMLMIEAQSDVPCQISLLEKYVIKWENPRPQGNVLMASDFLPSGKGWMVGYSGTVMFFDGAQWHSQQLGPEYADLRDVEAFTETDVWVVGDSGKIYHYDGAAWNGVNSGTTERLTAISALAPDNIWVSGEQGVFLHYDGVQWKQASHPLGASNIWTVHVAAPDSMWLSANKDFWEHNPVSGQWTPYRSPFGSPVAEFYSHGRENIWAAGGSSYAAVSHFNGQSWSSALGLSGMGSSSPHIDGSSEQEIFLAYTNELFLYDGYGWVAFPVPSDVQVWYHTLSVLRPQVFFAGGTDGALVKYDHGAWTPYTTNSIAKSGLNAIWALDETSLWAVGFEGEILTYQAQTDSWSSTVLESQPLYDIHASSPANVWAVGSSALVAHDDGTGWRNYQISDANLSAFRGVRALAEDDVWFVGSYKNLGDGVIYHFDGTRFQKYAMPPGTPAFYSLDMAPHTQNLYAGTCDGRVFKYDGATWSEFLKPPLHGEVSAIAVRSDQDIWIAVNYFAQIPYILHFDGIAWEIVSEGAGFDPIPISALAVSEDTVYATCKSGFLHIYKHAAWQKIPVMSRASRGVCVLPSGEFLIAGDDHILRGIPRTLCSDGDLDCNGQVNILDMQRLFYCIYGSGNCDYGDLNSDGSYNIFDLQQLINNIFS